MLEVKKKDRESFEGLIRRFTKKTIQSGKILQAKKVRFHQKPEGELAQKRRAIRKNQINKKRDYLRKIGKLDELIGSNKKSGFKKKRV